MQIKINNPLAVDLFNTTSDYAVDNLKENTPIILDKYESFIIGKKLGEGKQGIVYSSALNHDICIKLAKNAIANKQFKKEVDSSKYFDILKLKYPKIYRVDVQGRWIIKERWINALCGDYFTGSGITLPKYMIESLYKFVLKFESQNLCLDYMPSNVVFLSSECATFETTLWPIDSKRSWTFLKCFLPFWIQGGVQEGNIKGFPPYQLSLHNLLKMRNSWNYDPLFTNWRNYFGEMPNLSPDWWNIV